MTRFELGRQVKHGADPEKEARTKGAQIHRDEPTGEDSVPMTPTQCILRESQMLKMDRVGRVSPNVIQNQRADEHQTWSDEIPIIGMPVKRLAGF